MPEPIVKFGDREIPLQTAVTSLGRASDNTVAVPGDSNVSRYHAEIERRGDDFYLIDLGSSNGTTVNGEKLGGERLLNAGDLIVLGGSAKMEFGPNGASVAPSGADELSANLPSGTGMTGDLSHAAGDLASQAERDALMQVQHAVVADGAAAASSSGSGPVILVAGAICGIALVCVVAATAFYLTRGSSCDAKAAISKPEAGDAISEPTEIEVDAENTGCVAKAVFTIDGESFATADSPPFTATIDPKQFPDLSDGLDHSLEIALFDENGEQIGQSSGISLALETREIKAPSPTPVIAQNDNPQPAKTAPTTGSVSLLEIQEMSKRLVQQFSGQHSYNVSNKQFLQEVQKRTAEYAQEGYFQRASVYRDAINVAYVREQNLDAPLGFILAMSRSKFNPARQGDNEGLWQMSNTFVAANAYNGLCGTETLSDQSQNCAAKASALYMKAIVYGVFDGDPVYSAAAFGRSPQDASVWKAGLPADKTDIWNTIRTPQEREQLVRFFAAGIVAENPQKFGLRNDRPLSELYRFAM
jgi:pSer/pThr/pTyr-binding forkhead associated (FHA) protein